MSSTDEERERDFVRQSERTVDNLKRLTAYVFAISFTVAGMGVVRKLIPIFTDPSAQVPPLWYRLVNTEMLLTFAVTAGLFFYQGDKFLDNHLARATVPEPRRLYIALRYFVLVATMAPFFLMANALTPEVTDKVGFLWFFGSYVLLFSIGLVLVVVPAIDRAFRRGRGASAKMYVDDDHVIRTFWFAMNSAFLLLIVASFALVHWLGGDPCPARLSPDRAPLFLLTFGAIALARDTVDYTYAFRFHYPVREPRRYDLWPITSMLGARRLWPYYAVAVVMIGGVIFLLGKLHATDVNYWISACHV